MFLDLNSTSDGTVGVRYKETGESRVLFATTAQNPCGLLCARLGDGPRKTTAMETHEDNLEHHPSPSSPTSPSEAPIDSFFAYENVGPASATSHVSVDRAQHGPVPLDVKATMYVSRKRKAGGELFANSNSVMMSSADTCSMYCAETGHGANCSRPAAARLTVSCAPVATERVNSTNIELGALSPQSVSPTAPAPSREPILGESPVHHLPFQKDAPIEAGDRLLKARKAWDDLLAVLPKKKSRKPWLPPRALVFEAIDNGIDTSTAYALAQEFAVCCTNGTRKRCEQFVSMLRDVATSYLEHMKPTVVAVSAPSPAAQCWTPQQTSGTAILRPASQNAFEPEVPSAVRESSVVANTVIYTDGMREGGALPRGADLLVFSLQELIDIAFAEVS